MVDGYLNFDTKVNTQGFNTGTKTIGNSLSGLKSSLGKIGIAVAAAFSVTALINFGKQAVEIASDLQEVQNVVDTAFGESSYKMEEFADKAIETYGISKLTAKQTGSTFMAMASGMGIANNSASDMSLALTGLSADMASFYNVEQDVASTALKSVFTGETETLKQFGIVMTDANLKAFALSQGITKDTSAMSQAEKVQLRYNYVLNATKLAQGDFAKTQDSWANQTRILSERWKELKGTAGTVFMNVLAPAVKTINSALSSLISYAQGAYNALAKLFGWENTAADDTASAISDSVDNQNALTDAVEETTKAEEKSVAGFDTINTLTNNTANEAEQSDSLVSIPEVSSEQTSTPKIDVDTSAIEEKFEKLRLIFDKVKAPLEKLWGKLEPLRTFAADGFSLFFNEILVPLSGWTINDVLPRFLETIGIAAEFLGNVLNKYLDLFITFLNLFLKPLGKYTGKKFTDFLDKFNEKFQKLSDLVSQSEIWNDLKTILEKVCKVLEPMFENLINIKIWFADFALSDAFISLEYMFKNLEDAIGLVAAIINLDFSDAWEHLKDLLIDNKIDEAKEKFQNLKEKISDLKTAASECWENIKKSFSEAFDAIGEKISTWWNEKIAPWFTIEKWNELLQSMVDSFAQKWNEIYDFFTQSVPNWWNEKISPWFTKEKWAELINDGVEGIKSGWKTFLSFFTDALPNWWNEKIAPWFTIEKWQELGRNIKEGLVNAIAAAVNGIINVLNWFINKINKISIDIPEIKGITQGFHIGPNFDTIPQYVPKLATGTVVPANYGEFLAVLGDNSHEPEVVSPISAIEQALENVFARHDGAGGGDININFTGNLAQLARLLNPVITREQHRSSVFAK